MMILTVIGTPSIKLFQQAFGVDSSRVDMAGAELATSGDLRPGSFCGVPLNRASGSQHAHFGVSICESWEFPGSGNRTLD